jgi:hypothetical protein
MASDGPSISVCVYGALNDHLHSLVGRFQMLSHNGQVVTFRRSRQVIANVVAEHLNQSGQEIGYTHEGFFLLAALALRLISARLVFAGFIFLAGL